MSCVVGHLRISRYNTPQIAPYFFKFFLLYKLFIMLLYCLKELSLKIWKYVNNNLKCVYNNFLIFFGLLSSSVSEKPSSMYLLNCSKLQNNTLIPYMDLVAIVVGVGIGEEFLTISSILYLFFCTDWVYDIHFIRSFSIGTGVKVDECMINICI